MVNPADMPQTTADTLQRMEELADQLPDSFQGQLSASIKARRQWLKIQQEYPSLKQQHGAEKAWRILAERHNHSEGYIRKILYELSPTSKVAKN